MNTRPTPAVCRDEVPVLVPVLWDGNGNAFCILEPDPQSYDDVVFATACELVAAGKAVYKRNGEPYFCGDVKRIDHA